MSLLTTARSILRFVSSTNFMVAFSLSLGWACKMPIQLTTIKVNMIFAVIGLIVYVSRQERVVVHPECKPLKHGLHDVVRIQRECLFGVARSQKDQSSS